ncbi:MULTISPECIES: tyrosine-type recombinase/integrase [Paraburkholderia]|uniref:Tyrosine-type recombinase/integrase n=1 Tax=Paraburkholderia acidicola TaxID=1912599 RepID=A0ABV1LY99_9BURK
MNVDPRWFTEPATPFSEWQRTDAVGGDRRPFAQRSIIQHEAMFERFHRHLVAHRATVATFGEADLESFFNDIGNRCAAGTTTRLRYAKLVDRLCRHLIELGVRTSNPAAAYLRREAWPEDEPVPLFLDPASDIRLQAHVQEPTADTQALRDMAIVALLLGAGVTAAEIRVAHPSHLVVDDIRPHVWVPARGARAERKVTLPGFTLPVLAAWGEHCDAEPADHLFPSSRGGAMSDWTLIEVVRVALTEIGFEAPDMSPRVLRNTFARRLLLDGRSNHDVSVLLGLSSQRTVVRLRGTINAPFIG